MPQSLTEIKALLEARGMRPRKRFGQNFLIDHNKMRMILDAAELGAGDAVLEVGPGTGALTEWLLEAGAEVTAAEIDRDLAEILRERFGERESFALVEGDVMAGKHAIAPAVLEAIGDRPFKLIANLPYQVASPLLATLALDHANWTRAVVMVQREVGDRLLAESGKDFGPLSVAIGLMCEGKVVTHLPPGCFWPQPQVDSSVVLLKRRGEPVCDDLKRVMEMAQTLFQKRRKTVRAIVGTEVASAAGVDETLRPERLTVKQIVGLADAAG